MDATSESDYAFIDRSGFGTGIFYPRRDFSPAPPGASDHMVEVAPGVSVGARFYASDPAYPTILYFHGNGEVVPDYDGVAPIYHQAGLNLFVADFRGYGRSQGSPTFASLIADAHPVAAAFHSLLDERRIGPARFIMGRSLGSQPALELAARAPERFRGLILESGAANLRRLAARAGVDNEAATLVAAHTRKIESLFLPTLVIHGEVDELIPVEHAIELHGILTMPTKELVIIAGAGHNDIFWVGLSEYFEALTRFVARQVA